MIILGKGFFVSVINSCIVSNKKGSVILNQYMKTVSCLIGCKCAFSYVQE